MLTKLQIALGKTATTYLEDKANERGTTREQEAEAIINRVAGACKPKLEPVPKRRVRSKLGGL